MLYGLIFSFLGLVLLAYAVEYSISSGDDPREPRRLQPKIPLIGHIIGLIQSGPSYHSKLRSEQGS